MAGINILCFSVTSAKASVGFFVLWFRSLCHIATCRLVAGASSAAAAEQSLWQQLAEAQGWHPPGQEYSRDSMRYGRFVFLHTITPFRATDGGCIRGGHTSGTSP